MIAGIIALVIVAIGAVGVSIATQNFKKKKNRSRFGALLAGVCALLLLIVPMSFHTVEAAVHVAVQIQNLGIGVSVGISQFNLGFQFGDARALRCFVTVYIVVFRATAVSVVMSKVPSSFPVNAPPRRSTPSG